MKTTHSLNIFLFFLVGLIVLADFIVSPVYAAVLEAPGQPQSEKVALDSSGVAKLESWITDLKEKIAAAQEAENEGTAKQFGVSVAQLQEQTALLREIEGNYQRQITALKRQESLQKEQENLDKEFASQQELLVTEPPPYSLSTYDGLLDQLATADKQEQTANVSLKASRKTLEEAKTRLEEASHNVREAHEELQAHTNKDNGLLLNWNLEQERINKELALASLIWRG